MSVLSQPAHRSSVAPVVKDPELFFAIVAPMGSNTDAAVDALREALDDWNYKLKTIKISDLVKHNTIFGNFGDGLNTYEHYKAGIEACNTAPAKLASNDAMVRMALIKLESLRVELHGDPENINNRIIPLPRQAYVFQSLKLPEEVETLRKVYGPAFFSISIHAHKETRLRSLEARIQERHTDSQFM